MKLNRLLQEDQGGILHYKEFFHKINQECSDYISTVTTPYYRGTKNGQTVFGERLIRTNRKPMTATEEETLWFNAMIKSMYGIEDVRYRCAFMTNDIKTAKHFGSIQYVFPKNGTQYLIYKERSDSNSIMAFIGADAFRFFSTRISSPDRVSPDERDEFLSIIEERLSDDFVYLEKPTRFMNTYNPMEVMIFGQDSYYTIDMDEFKFLSYQQLLDNIRSS